VKLRRDRADNSACLVVVTGARKVREVLLFRPREQEGFGIVGDRR
jgi:hypothetical protein